MNFVKRLIVTCLIASLAICSTIVPASATTYSKSATIHCYNSASFKNAWEKTATYTGTYEGEKITAYMVYGFDTFATDEDFVWTKGSYHSTVSGVERVFYDEECIHGPVMLKKDYSKIEVKHKTYSVRYSIEFNVTLLNLTSKTATSSVKL